MRIENTIPYYNFDKYQAAVNKNASELPQNTNYYGPGVIVEISKEAKDYTSQSKANAPEGTQKLSEAMELEGCQTCKNRKYVDGSSDPSVSYQSPQHIDPRQAGTKVMAHEREHVNNEQTRAEREERRVISQFVSLSTAICPECGKLYISGGVTRTVTASDRKAASETGAEKPSEAE